MISNKYVNGTKLLKLLNKIEDEKLKKKVLALYKKLKDRITFYPASSAGHHNWYKGWSDHTAQVTHFGITLYNNVIPKDRADFTLDDVILVCFVHDLDKLWRYKETEGKKRKKKVYFDLLKREPFEPTSKVVAECFRNGIELTDQHIEAINNHHGGFTPHLISVQSKNVKLSKLSSLVHSADLFSCYYLGDWDPEAVKIVLAPKVGIEAYEDLAQEIIKKCCGLEDGALVTDDSFLSDFDCRISEGDDGKPAVVPNTEEALKKIKEIYGLDVSKVKNLNLLNICKYISAKGCR